MSLPIHGANPHRVYEQLNIQKPSTVIDFSENVNPAGPPTFLQQQWDDYFQFLQTYPDPNGEPFLSAISNHHKLPKDFFFVGNGAAEIFSLLAMRYTGKKAIIVHPTFIEYEVTLTTANVEIEHIVCEDIAEWKLPIQKMKREMQQADVLYLCTPNNPTGVLPKRQELEELISYGVEVSCDVILDEAFIDWIEHAESFIKDVLDFPNLMVVRSMTKMYAIPGGRLGYLIAQPHIVSEVSRHASHWHINGLATVIGARCLDEHDYVKVTCQNASRELARFKSFLQSNHCIYTNSVTNFLSFQLPNPEFSSDLYQYLLAKGFVLRHSENFKGMNGDWFRVGMKNEGQMQQLMGEMQQWFEKNSSL